MGAEAALEPKRSPTVSFRWPFSIRSSGQVSAGLQSGLTAAAAAGLPASIDQSAGLENRALSLGSDFIQEIVLEAP